MQVPITEKNREQEDPMAEKNMSRFESPCTKYIYDPAVGDYERNIPPGTPFEDLPEDWCCPLCGAEKEYFEELDDQNLRNVRRTYRFFRR